MDRDPIKLVLVVIDRGRGDRMARIVGRQMPCIGFVCYGTGAADSRILDLLGLEDTDKDVIMTLAPNSRITALLDEITLKMRLHRPGGGIAFIMPLSGVSSLTAGALLSGGSALAKDSRKEAFMQNYEYHLIAAALNPGYTEPVMEAARAVGARGGTVLSARAVGVESVKNFLGISIQDNKEILIILTPTETRMAIMTEINQKFGLTTEAQGLVFSLPVESVSGI